MACDIDELKAAFEHFQQVASESALSGDWRPWVETCFTPDVHYVEHHYGEMNGHAEVLEWITATMATWPFDHMTRIYWDWATLDAEQGWVIGQVENGFDDPGDGTLRQAPNWTRLVYAGDGLFKEEEDVYNPVRFGPVVSEWVDTWKAHHPRS